MIGALCRSVTARGPPQRCVFSGVSSEHVLVSAPRRLVPPQVPISYHYLSSLTCNRGVDGQAVRLDKSARQLREV